MKSVLSWPAALAVLVSGISLGPFASADELSEASHRAKPASQKAEQSAHNGTLAEIANDEHEPSSNPATERVAERATDLDDRQLDESHEPGGDRETSYVADRGDEEQDENSPERRARRARERSSRASRRTPPGPGGFGQGDQRQRERWRARIRERFAEENRDEAIERMSRMRDRWVQRRFDEPRRERQARSARSDDRRPDNMRRGRRAGPNTRSWRPRDDDDRRRMARRGPGGRPTWLDRGRFPSGPPSRAEFGPRRGPGPPRSFAGPAGPAGHLRELRHELRELREAVQRLTEQLEKRSA